MQTLENHSVTFLCRLNHVSIPDCGRDVRIPNGQVDFINALTTYGESVPVICDRGYELKGDRNIKCLANSSWSSSTVCEIKGMLGYVHAPIT